MCSTPSLPTIYFYPRSPCGERQEVAAYSRLPYRISIHALLAESDFFLFMVYTMFVYFYPRSPCGERHAGVALVGVHAEISIHALLAESDL